MVDYPAGSGVKARLHCDGDFSGNNIRGYSSVLALESHLDKTEGKGWLKTEHAQWNKVSDKGAVL